MADQSSQSITIGAQPAEVMSVIADFDRYPEWADGVRTCQVLETYDDGRAKQVRFTVDAGFIKDDYVLAYQWAPDGHRVDWQLVKAHLQRSQQGSYQLRPAGEQATEVTYSLTVDLAVPLIGPLKRKAERVIMDTALKKLKTRVEG